MKTPIAFFLLLVTLPVCARTGLQQEIHAKVSLAAHAVQQNSAADPISNRQNQIRAALQQVLEKNLLPRAEAMTFDLFLARSKEKDQENDRLFNLYWERESFFRKAFFFKGQPEMLFQGKPQYVQEIRGKKFIFISENSSHDASAIVKETGAILTAVRQANPSARIVLASEFSIVSDTHVWPIRFAGTKNENIFTFDLYDTLDPVADQLNIDVLALDDACQVKTADGKVFSKIGPKWVLWNSQHPEIVRIASDFGFEPKTDDSYLSHQKAAFGYFLQSNPYGITLRNQQWASYIRAVEPFYDVIIVYGGNGHISSNGARDSVPLMLNPARAVSFSMYSSEELSEEDEKHYQLRNQIQAHYRAPLEEGEDTQLADDDENLPEEDLFDEINRSLDFHKNYYRRYNGQTQRAWYVQHLRSSKAYQQWLKKEADIALLIGRGTLNYPAWLNFDVYINP